MSDFQHVRESYRYVLSLPAKERKRFMDHPKWIGYAAATELLDELQELLEKPRRDRMPCMLVCGESNNGKTTLVRRFAETCGKPSIDENVDPVKPVIVAQAPPKADEKGLYLAILSRFHAPHRTTDDSRSLCYQVLRLFRRCHVRMLVIDEFHSLWTGTAIKQREVMNAIKFLCNELQVPVVGVGTREAVRVLHVDPQHASRFTAKSLPLWQLDKDFQRMLRSIEMTLPLRNPSGLHRPESARRLHAISGGNLGDLLALVTACARDAIDSGTERIDEATIEKFACLRPTAGIQERVG